jgi:hypothetical protein
VKILNILTNPILVVAALLLGWGLSARAQARDCISIPPAAKIVEVGAFTNTRYTDEHAYGYTVMLWRAGDCLFGLFEASAGLAGDAPIGVIDNVKFDGKTGALSFTAKLTTGMVTFAGSGDAQPARDMFTFEGRLQPAQLAGVVTHDLQNKPQRRPERTTVTMVTSKDAAELMRGSETYGDWYEKWQPILRQRGPKW